MIRRYWTLQKTSIWRKLFRQLKLLDSYTRQFVILKILDILLIFLCMKFQEPDKDSNWSQMSDVNSLHISIGDFALTFLFKKIFFPILTFKLMKSYRFLHEAFLTFHQYKSLQVLSYANYFVLCERLYTFYHQSIWKEIKLKRIYIPKKILKKHLETHTRITI